MKLRYVGTLPDGFVQDRATEMTYSFKHGVPIEVPDALGDELIKTGVWKKSSEQKAVEKEIKT